MSMTRKHFERLAKICRDLYDDMPKNTHGILVERLAKLCAESNTWFDYTKFYEASCYYGKQKGQANEEAKVQES
jgi:hypothetical protein